MKSETDSLDSLQHIRRMMERSNRFLSLSGFSGIAAGVWALIGAFIAWRWLNTYYIAYKATDYSDADFTSLKWKLLLLAGAVLGAALLSAFYFTWRRAQAASASIWDRSARMLISAMMTPLVAGGLVILIVLLQWNEWRLAVPLTLIFYGLALVSGSRYTLSDIMYLGYCEIVLGLISTQYTGYGLYFWAFGFGVLHILYGIIMWWKYERGEESIS